MSCKITEDRLMTFMLDELPAREKQNLENHINKCSYCQNQLQALNQLKLIWDNPTHYLDESFTNNLMTNITTSNYIKIKRKSYKNELIHFALAATATIALFTTGVFDQYSVVLNKYGANIARGTTEFNLLFIKGSLWLDSLHLQIVNSLPLF